MPKNTLVIGAVVIVILAAVGGYFLLNKSNTLTNENNTENNIISLPVEEKSMEAIKEFLSGKSLECHYEEPQKGNVVAYIKDGKVRVNYSAPEESNSGSVIIKDKMMYFWNTEQAFKMAVPEEDEVQDTQESTPEQQAPDNVVREIEAYKDSCKEASVSDSQFDLPAGVNFQDFSTMMESMMMEEQQGSTGGQIPTVDPQYQELMQQYTNPQ